MKIKSTRFRELVDLKWALGLSFVIALYAIYLLWRFISGHPTGPLTPGWLLVLLSVWMIAAVTIAYRNWRHIGLTEKDLEEIITSINPDVFVVINPDRRISMCSPAVARVFGYTPEEVVGQTTDLLYFDRRPSAAGSIQIHDQLERVGFHVGEATGRLRNGGTLPLEIITGTIRGRRGAVLLIRDVSKRYEIEAAHREKADLLKKLEEQYQRLRDTEEGRDGLLQMIVHDMKNPLQIILGNMQLLREECATRASTLELSYVDETLVHTRYLSGLVASILDISRLEAGKMPIRPSPCDLHLAVRRVMAALQRMTGTRQMRIFAPADPVTVHCDADLMDRVLTNLISNALNHTPTTSNVEVRVLPGDGLARVEIIDDGPGIPTSLRERLFQKFATGATRSNSGSTSTGLGLTFCKLVVETHGGRIGFDCPATGGTTFWIEIPTQHGVQLAVTTPRGGAA